jgi:hypothetical protein
MYHGLIVLGLRKLPRDPPISCSDERDLRAEQPTMRATDSGEACSEKRRQANNRANLNYSRTSFGSDRGAMRLFTGSIPMLRRESPIKSPLPSLVVCFDRRLADLMSASRSFSRSLKELGEYVCQALRRNG